MPNFVRFSWSFNSAFNLGRAKRMDVHGVCIVVVREVNYLDRAYLLNPNTTPMAVLVFQSNDPVPVENWLIGENSTDVFRQEIEASLLALKGKRILSICPLSMWPRTQSEEQEVQAAMFLAKQTALNEDHGSGCMDDFHLATLLSIARMQHCALIASRNLTREEHIAHETILSAALASD